MGQYTHGRLATRIKELAATFIQLESNTSSLITVTRVGLSDKFTHAIIYVTVLPAEKEKEALDFLSRRRRIFAEKFSKEIHLRRIPRFEFAADTSSGLF